ncbi:GntR family transcriptional regulator [Vibrio parahaemolyticus]|nr:GntR family transcriptional regulator [Vibrio parahaemolyticus]NMR86152.1 GntR family transcriptional regulator [Vibrio parahaemolyticus]
MQIYDPYLQNLRKTDIAYIKIKDMILNGENKPGEIISSYKLSEYIKLTRTPITNALKKLEQEGIIEIIPQVGCTIKRPDLNTIIEDMKIRACLEALACEMACKNATLDDINELSLIIQENEKCDENSLFNTNSKYNEMFHYKIIEMANMPNLKNMILSFWNNIIYRAISVDFVNERVEISVTEHKKILEAFENKDCSLARTLMESHLKKCSDDYLKKDVFEL